MLRACLTALIAAAGLAGAAAAQPAAPAPAKPAAPPAPPNLLYGPNITLEQAKQVVAAGEAEAAKRGLPITIAVVDTAGGLVFFEKSTNTPGTAEAFAVKKAVAAVRNRHPSIYDAQRLAAGNASVPFVPDVFPFPGGYPIVYQGKIIGAVGETGGADDDVAKAAADAPLR
jgi:glc operon protein GlcG